MYRERCLLPEERHRRPLLEEREGERCPFPVEREMLVSSPVEREIMVSSPAERERDAGFSFSREREMPVAGRERVIPITRRERERCP